MKITNFCNFEFFYFMLTKKSTSDFPNLSEPKFCKYFIPKPQKVCVHNSKYQGSGDFRILIKYTIYIIL